MTSIKAEKNSSPEKKVSALPPLSPWTQELPFRPQTE